MPNKQVDKVFGRAFKDQRSAGENTIVQRGAGYYPERVARMYRWWWRNCFCAQQNF
ncbi:hypothetical protein KCP73_03010 [Salmonella enterica subsp. enterica]|nr:hypothetical protein KCP73_03010 [Salmonella enterica subsp. enterica]